MDTVSSVSTFQVYNKLVTVLIPNMSNPCFLGDYGGGRGGYDDFDNGELSEVTVINVELLMKLPSFYTAASI